jgi:hypothetical protein
MDIGRFESRQYGYFVAEFYHLERNHPGLENRLITPAKTIDGTTGTVLRRQGLGGMLNYYYREAA